MLYLPLTGAEITVPVAQTVVNIVSFVLNGSFLLALYNKKKLGIPYNRGDFFVLNIALVDLLVTLRFTWQVLFITGANDAVCFLDAFWTLAFLGAEMTLMFGLSLERYLGVVKGMRADKRMVVALLTVCWLTGIIFDGVLSVAIGPYGPTPSGTGCTLEFWESRGVSAFISLQLLFVWVTMIFFYYRVWKVSRDAMHAVNTTREGERTLALRLFMIVFLFLACWTPAGCAFAYCAITGLRDPAWLSGFAGVFLAINTIVDPAVFLWINPDNRKALVALLTCSSPVSKIRRKITSRGSSQRTTRTSQTRELSPSRGEPVNTPPASPTGPAGASEPSAVLAPVSHLPLLQLALSSSDSTPEPLSPSVVGAEAHAHAIAESKTNDAAAQDSPRDVEYEGDSRQEPGSVSGTPTASNEENEEPEPAVAHGQVETTTSEQGSKQFQIVVVAAE